MKEKSNKLYSNLRNIENVKKKNVTEKLLN